MGSMDPSALVGLLADDDRLRVTAAIVLGAQTSDAVVAATGLGARKVHRALERLAAGGLVTTADRGGLAVSASTFQAAARAAAEQRQPAGPTPEDLGATPEQADVLRNFLVDGRLERIPAARSKRLVVLDFLASSFEPGRVYPERDVNFELGKRHRDYAALRRYLVDEGFLERRDGFYWRAGGTFDVDGLPVEPPATSDESPSAP